MDAITMTLEGFAETERALNQLGDVAQPFVNEGSGESADAIAREARARLERQTGHAEARPGRPDLGKGLSAAGLSARPAYDGNGYVVVDEREPFPSVPFWVEKGTVHMPARPFFYVSADLEAGPHLRRMQDALRRAIEASGLGE